MWKIYKWNGRYIQGDLISKHSSEDAALKKAASEIKFTFVEKVRTMIPDKIVMVYHLHL